MRTAPARPRPISVSAVRVDARPAALVCAALLLALVFLTFRIAGVLAAWI
jgi:hypothetical protein